MKELKTLQNSTILNLDFFAVTFFGNFEIVPCDSNLEISATILLKPIILSVQDVVVRASISKIYSC